MSIAVLDIETQELVPENRDLSVMHVSLAGIKLDDRTLFFGEQQMEELFRVLDAAELIVGHNLLRFDYPVLQRYTAHNIQQRYAQKTFDIQHVLMRKTDRLIGLNDLALRNLGATKSGSGKDAPQLYKDGKMDELKQYLEQDVLLTARIFELILLHGKLKVGIITYKEPVEREIAISPDDR